MAANSALAKSARSVKYDLHQRVNRMPFGQNGFKKTTSDVGFKHIGVQVTETQMVNLHGS